MFLLDFMFVVRLSEVFTSGQIYTRAQAHPVHSQAGQGSLKWLSLLICLYISLLGGDQYIRPQGVENRASRPLSRT